MSATARVKALLGWPLRRALDPRVRMTVHEIDARLGSEGLTRPTLHDRLDDLDRIGRDMLAGLGWRDVPQPGGAPEQLDAPGAAHLNWASGPEGYAAQAGLWFNPPVPVHHDAAAVQPLLVNERIVERPFVFGALATTRQGCASCAPAGRRARRCAWGAQTGSRGSSTGRRWSAMRRARDGTLPARS